MEIKSESSGIEIVLNNSSYGVKIEIGKNVVGKTKINAFGSGVTIKIEDDCKFKNQYIVGDAGTEIHIGAGSTFNHDCNFGASSGWNIDIGKDCMFSFDVVIQAGDSHALFLLDTKKRYNLADSNKNIVKLGDHCWVGLRTTILGHTEIGNGCVIGAGSLVKGKFKQFSVIAGNPAKIVKENIAWSRDNASEDFSDCGDVYDG